MSSTQRKRRRIEDQRIGGEADAFGLSQYQIIESVERPSGDDSLPGIDLQYNLVTEQDSGILLIGQAESYTDLCKDLGLCN